MRAPGSFCLKYLTRLTKPVQCASRARYFANEPPGALRRPPPGGWGVPPMEPPGRGDSHSNHNDIGVRSFILSGAPIFSITLASPCNPCFSLGKHIGSRLLRVHLSALRLPPAIERIGATKAAVGSSPVPVAKLHRVMLLPILAFGRATLPAQLPTCAQRIHARRCHRLHVDRSGRHAGIIEPLLHHAERHPRLPRMIV